MSTQQQQPQLQQQQQQQPKVNKKKKSKGTEKIAIELANENEYDFQQAPSLQQKVYVCSKLGQLENVYRKGPQLGLGAFAKVVLGKHRASGAEYAIKSIDRSKMLWGDRDALEDEINNLMVVRDGPNIVQLYEVYEEKSRCYLVMELMRGGELFDVILDRKIFSEREARTATRCLLRGLQYMHERRVAHRDLKPENLLLADVQNVATLKLADFGFAKRVLVDNGCRTLCGTPGYLAPEILERWPAYDTKCDLWGVGVILFLLLSGYLPFEDEEEDKVFEKTRNGQYFFHPSYWKTVSKTAKNFVTKFLTINPKKRYAASEALQDEWMTAAGALQEEEDDAAALESAAAGTANLSSNGGGKEKVKAAPVSNRLQVLNDNFAGYLERKGDNSTTRVTGSEQDKQDKPIKNKFVEDSAAGLPIQDFYEFGDLLGEGGYAKVYRAVHKRTNEVYAIKDIDTSVLENNSFNALKDEIAALKMLRGGPYIIRLYDTFSAKGNTYMVMEMCKGGDLLDRVTEKEFYTEREARKTCTILFQAMDYIHKKKIAHRDIKPENVLMVEKEDDTSIKIADFGFAKRVHKPNCLRTLCGTAQYVAPEVLDLHSPGYDQRADMWSVGVVTYILLGGYAPFDGPVHELANVICRGEYEFHDKYWSDISDAAKTMIRNLLQIDPEKRYSAELALQCPWMMLDEELLAVGDLSGAQAALKQKKEDGGADEMKLGPMTKGNNKTQSFLSGVGTFEEFMARQQGGTPDLERVAEDSDEEDIIEDSSSGKVFEELYQWGRVIEQGDFSTTREARHKKSKEYFTVKSIKRSDLETVDAVAVQDEISTLQMLKECPHIITLHDVFEEPDYTFMVIERLQGGELIDRVIEKSHYTENEARRVAKNILAGLEFCHDRRIANRNIKTENLLLPTKDDLFDVRISDFGFAKRVLYPNSLKTQIGTEGYVAPEIIEHRPAYDVQCDMWSLGVVLYMLIGGYRPFRGEGEEVLRMTRYGEYKFHKRYWKDISEEAKILIARMLTVDPICRITATAALHSDWIRMNDDGEVVEEERPGGF